MTCLKELLCDFSSLSALHVCHIFAICRSTAEETMYRLYYGKKSQALSMSPHRPYLVGLALNYNVLATRESSEEGGELFHLHGRA